MPDVLVSVLARPPALGHGLDMPDARLELRQARDVAAHLDVPQPSDRR